MGHFTEKLVTDYFWIWFPRPFFSLTALTYAFVVRSNRRLPAGFFWIGFPIGLDRLLRVGLVSIDQHDLGPERMRWSLSFFEATFHPRTIRAMLPVPIQYLEVDANTSGNDLDTASAESDHTKIGKANAFKLLL